jgi:hypothetical protein
MVERRSSLLVAVSLVAFGLMAPTEAADVATTLAPAQPYVAPAPAAVPVTTTAPPARDNSLIVMPIPPQPSRATVRRGGASNRQSDQQAAHWRSD